MASKTLPKRAVGATGLELTEIGLGAATLGNLYREVSDDQARSTVLAALEAGIRHVDTAPFYGFGLSERRVGDAVRGVDDVIISTKVGAILRPDKGCDVSADREGFLSPMPFACRYDYSYDGIMRSWDASLQRLGLSGVDILFIHDFGTRGSNNEMMFGQLTRAGGFRALEELRGSGAIRAFGLGVNEWEVCLEAAQHATVDVILLAGRYTLLDHTASLGRFMPVCLREHISLVIGGVFNSGILATGSGGAESARYDYAPASAEVIARVRKLEAVCAAHGVRLASAALQFVLAHPAVVSAVLGLRSPEEVTAAMRGYHEMIPDQFWHDLKGEGLIAADAPTPVAPRQTGRSNS